MEKVNIREQRGKAKKGNQN